MGWLAASPDAKVVDPSFQPPNGIAEFKCPFSKRDKSPVWSLGSFEGYGTLHKSLGTL